MNVRRGIPGAIVLALIGIKLTTANPSSFDFWAIPVLQTNVGTITKVIYTLLTSFTTFLIFTGLGIKMFLHFSDNVDLNRAIRYVIFFGFYGIVIGLLIDLTGYKVPIISNFAVGEDATAVYLIEFVLLSLIPWINCIVFILVGVSLAWYFGSIVFFTIDAQRTIHPFLFAIPLFFASGYFLHLRISKSRIGSFYIQNVWAKYKHTAQSKIMLAMLFFALDFLALWISKRLQFDWEWALVIATLLWFPGSVVLIKLITRKMESVKEKIKLQQRLDEKKEQLKEAQEKIREKEYQLEILNEENELLQMIISTDPKNLQIIKDKIRKMSTDELEERESELNRQLQDLSINLRNSELQVKQLNNDLANLKSKEIEKQQLLDQKIEEGDAANLRVLADTLLTDYRGRNLSELEKVEPENEIAQIIKEICINKALIKKISGDIKKIKGNATNMRRSKQDLELEKSLIHREKINAEKLNILQLQNELENIRREEWILITCIRDLEYQLGSKSKPTLKIGNVLPISFTIVTGILAILYLM